LRADGERIVAQTMHAALACEASDRSAPRETS
jgi:hypothetical protein